MMNSHKSFLIFITFTISIPLPVFSMDKAWEKTSDAAQLALDEYLRGFAGASGQLHTNRIHNFVFGRSKADIVQEDILSLRLITANVDGALLSLRLADGYGNKEQTKEALGWVIFWKNRLNKHINTINNVTPEEIIAMKKEIEEIFDEKDKENEVIDIADATPEELKEIADRKKSISESLK